MQLNDIKYFRQAHSNGEFDEARNQFSEGQPDLKKFHPQWLTSGNSFSRGRRTLVFKLLFQEYHRVGPELKRYAPWEKVPSAEGQWGKDFDLGPPDQVQLGRPSLRSQWQAPSCEYHQNQKHSKSFWQVGRHWYDSVYWCHRQDQLSKSQGGTLSFPEFTK